MFIIVSGLANFRNDPLSLFFDYVKVSYTDVKENIETIEAW